MSGAVPRRLRAFHSIAPGTRQSQLNSNVMVNRQNPTWRNCGGNIEDLRAELPA